MPDFNDDLNIDLTPLIDVIFMLVIFFIMTMSFSTPVIDILLPNSTTATNNKISNSLNIIVNSSGNIFVDKKEITNKELENMLNNNQYEALNLYIDKDTKTQYLIDIADLSRKYTEGKLYINIAKE